MLDDKFDFFLFYSNLKLVLEGIGAGATGIIIDLESKGKKHRQDFYNTQINKHEISNIQEIRKLSPIKLICRINGGDYLSGDEISAAIEAGADEILIPMVTSLKEIDFVLKLAKNQSQVSVMIETTRAIELGKEINEYPIKRVFVGLNDLAIARGSDNIFLPLVDGTIDEIRLNIDKPFGVAGLTHPNAGFPIVNKFLINEMKRLNCSFGFLRRSYYRDLEQYTQLTIIDALKESLNTDFNLSHALKLKELVLNIKEPLLSDSI
jgi:hypothetical protein